MSEKEVKKCHKCGGEMVKGKGLAGGYGFVRYLKMGDSLRGDKTIAFHCKNCGYIEIYKEMKGERR